jgi:Ca2+-binding RTX toxin-like protein
MKGVIRKGLGVAAGLLLLVPASALAGEASVVGGVPRFDAYFGETNAVTVGQLAGPNPGTITVRYVDAVEIKPLGGCFHPNETALRVADCVVPDDTTLARAGLGNRDDRLEPSATRPPLTFGFSSEGDLGEDTLLGTPQRDVLDGVGGADVIRGRAGDDGLEGGNGADDIKGEGGDDTLDGDDNSGGDSLDCGSGLDDSAVFDLGDTVATTCETQTQN